VARDPQERAQRHADLSARRGRSPGSLAGPAAEPRAVDWLADMHWVLSTRWCPAGPGRRARGRRAGPARVRLVSRRGVAVGHETRCCLSCKDWRRGHAPVSRSARAVRGVGGRDGAARLAPAPWPPRPVARVRRAQPARAAAGGDGPRSPNGDTRRPRWPTSCAGLRYRGVPSSCFRTPTWWRASLPMS
jgi:hypothetical protein